MYPNTTPAEFIRLEEPEYLQSIRNRSKIEFDRLGFPNSHQEDWKYTPVNRYLPTQISSEIEISDEPVHKEAFFSKTPFQLVDAYHIVLINGKYDSELSDSLPDSVSILLPINEAFQDPTFINHFNSLGEVNSQAFIQLNTARFDRGLFIKIKKNQKLDKPIHFIHTYRGEHTIVLQPRILLVVEPNGECTILESQLGSLDPESSPVSFCNQVVECFLETGAHLEYLRYQKLEATQCLVSNDQIQVGKGAHYRSHTFSLSGKLIRNNLQINLSEPGSTADLFGFYTVGHEELIDNHTLVRHLKPNCESNELYKGILEGKSIGVFNGRVEVKQDAQKTNAYQQNQTILLSKEATMNSKPELEIYADDVKCSHGSTMGQMDKGALFYLKSRGISEASAKKMLIGAFAHTVLSEIPILAIREEIAEQLDGFEPESKQIGL